MIVVGVQKTYEAFVNLDDDRATRHGFLMVKVMLLMLLWSQPSESFVFDLHDGEVLNG